MSRHWQPKSVVVTPQGELTFVHKDTGQIIRVSIPATGIYENDPKKSLTQEDAQSIADGILPVIKSVLD